jgi:hypothetical protein
MGVSQYAFNIAVFEKFLYIIAVLTASWQMWGLTWSQASVANYGRIGAGVALS